MALVLNGTTGASMVQDDAVNPVTDIASGIPCFSAYRTAAQTLTSTIITKINFDTIEFDTTNAYDETTNFRFQPQIAGYYKVDGMVLLNSGATSSNIGIYIYKNSVEHRRGEQRTYPSTASINSASISMIVYMNGASDYIELHCGATGTSLGLAVGSAGLTYFQAHLIVGA